MITFQQHSSSRYPPRTFENASADATIAFAFDFNTPGEKLTKEAAKTQGKIYIPVTPLFRTVDIEKTLIKLNSKFTTTINIAGNQLATCIKYNCDQNRCDTLVYDFLKMLLLRSELNNQITLIRSGGQSGFDESALKAAVKLGIPALCVCPQGWKFNDKNGRTISDEGLFKGRFL
jgi:hypothetical protein